MILKELSKKNIKNIEKFAKGHRSFVYIGVYKNKKVAIKVGRRVKYRISNEVKWLKKLNKFKIGPKILFFGKNYFVYEFVEGERFQDFLEKSDKKEIKKVLEKIFDKLRILDKLKVNKEELQNPYKHILVGKEVKLIDFERCGESKKPKNITQFCQYLMSGKIYSILNRKGFSFDKEKLIKILKIYKKEESEKNFKDIKKFLLLNG